MVGIQYEQLTSMKQESSKLRNFEVRDLQLSFRTPINFAERLKKSVENVS